MIAISAFPISWVLVQDLALGPAPVATRHLNRLEAEGISSVLSLCSTEEKAAPADLEQRFHCRRLVLPDHRSRGTLSICQLEEALAALADQSYVDAYVQQVGQARDWLVNQCVAAGVRHHAAGGNYLLLWPKQGPALVEARLREAGILVRSMDGKPLISGSLRVSIGTLEHMQRFWAAYAAIEHPTT